MTHEPVGDVRAPRRRTARRRPRRTGLVGRGGAPTTTPSTGASSATSGFVWGPEGLDEADAGLLGDVRGRPRAGGRGGRRAVLALARRPGRAAGGGGPVHRDAAPGRGRSTRTARCRWSRRTPAALPLADASVDVACSAYGAVPFVADSAALMREVARVLRPGGRWVFSATPPAALGAARRPRRGRAGRAELVLRPDAVRRGGSGRAGRVRRAPPHPGRPGARAGGRRVRAGRPGGAGVAGRATSRPGAAGARCAVGWCPAPPSSSATWPRAERRRGGRPCGRPPRRLSRC